ncbi:MAG TPA: glycosyltransferase family 2 protein [Aggregatilineales bacterium]|nr:glycosyltransferase family 2 protein [Aggregatilineales bacterium]
MNHEPRVSVVMATHNRAELLGRALDSVLAQTYRNFEIIVVDDASRDSTQEVLREYQRKHDNIRVLNLRQNVGAGAARNRGIQLARGEYVAIMDDDDVCVPTRFEQQLEVFEKHPTVELCFGLVQWVDANLQPLRVSPGIVRRGEFPADPTQVFTLMLFESNQVPHVAIMVKRKTVLRYPYPEDVSVGEDWEVVLSMAANRVTMHGIPQVLVLVDRSANREGLMQKKDSVFRDQRRILVRVCRAHHVSYTMMFQAFSRQLTREARHWSRLRGILLAAVALLLWRENQLARTTLNEIMYRAWNKVQRVKRA